MDETRSRHGRDVENRPGGIFSETLPTLMQQFHAISLLMRQTVARYPVRGANGPISVANDATTKRYTVVFNTFDRGAMVGATPPPTALSREDVWHFLTLTFSLTLSSV